MALIMHGLTGGWLNYPIDFDWLNSLSIAKVFKKDIKDMSFTALPFMLHFQIFKTANGAQVKNIKTSNCKVTLVGSDMNQMACDGVQIQYNPKTGRYDLLAISPDTNVSQTGWVSTLKVTSGGSVFGATSIS